MEKPTLRILERNYQQRIADVKGQKE